MNSNDTLHEFRKKMVTIDKSLFYRCEQTNWTFLRKWIEKQTWWSSHAQNKTTKRHIVYNLRARRSNCVLVDVKVSFSIDENIQNKTGIWFIGLVIAFGCYTKATCNLRFFVTGSKINNRRNAENIFRLFTF